MAMTNCKECGTDISSTARACPKCGAVVPRPKVWPWLVGVPIGALALFLIYGASIPEYKAKALEQRRLCEDVFHASQSVCDRIYYEALAKGEARAQK